MAESIHNDWFRQHRDAPFCDVGKYAWLESQAVELSERLEALKSQAEFLEERHKEKLDALDRDIQKISFYKSFNEKLKRGNNSILFVHGVVFVFIAYVVGQICIAFGKIVVFQGERRSAMALRVAKVARRDNSVLNSQLDDLQSLILVCAGLSALPMVLACAEIPKFVSYGFAWSMLLAPWIAVTYFFSGTFYFFEKLGTELDQILSEYESKRSDQTEN